LALSLLASSAAFAGPKSKCKKKYTEVSCAEVEGAKREYFCWKGKLADEKRDKICKSEKKKRKHKKSTKRKGS
jgi:hypothetical protein